MQSISLNCRYVIYTLMSFSIFIYLEKKERQKSVGASIELKIQNKTRK